MVRAEPAAAAVHELLPEVYRAAAAGDAVSALRGGARAALDRPVESLRIHQHSEPHLPGLRAEQLDLLETVRDARCNLTNFRMRAPSGQGAQEPLQRVPLGDFVEGHLALLLPKTHAAAAVANFEPDKALRAVEVLFALVALAGLPLQPARALRAAQVAERALPLQDAGLLPDRAARDAGGARAHHAQLPLALRPAVAHAAAAAAAATAPPAGVRHLRAQPLRLPLLLPASRTPSVASRPGARHLRAVPQYLHGGEDLARLRLPAAHRSPRDILARGTHSDAHAQSRPGDSEVTFKTATNNRLLFKQEKAQMKVDLDKRKRLLNVIKLLVDSHAIEQKVV